LLLNPRAGDESGTEELVEAAAARGVQAYVLREEDDLEQVAGSAPEGPIGVAGGDGSLARVAAVCRKHGVPFVCVPSGTRNHFARDLGLDPGDPVAAVDAFIDARERRIDMGWANGRPFLNNVSLGVYARLVHRRERHRRRREVLARVRALAAVARHPQAIGITVDGAPIESRVVVIANNAYTLELMSLGERKRLDEGRLHLYAPTGLVRSRWDERAGERFVVDARVARVDAAVDGEPSELETPVEFRVDPGALRVLVPESRE
jgi:diacylglycerol kinase family enzyme